MLKLLQWLPFFSNLRKHPECLKPTSALKKKKKNLKKPRLGHPGVTIKQIVNHNTILKLERQLF